MIEAQLATGATHDMRIFTGSALLAAPVPKRPRAHTPASASFRICIVSSSFAGLARFCLGKLHVAKEKIVGGPTDFGKPHIAPYRPGCGTDALRCGWLKVSRGTYS